MTNPGPGATNTSSATRTFRAMATDITVRIEHAAPDDLGFDLVAGIFAEVERECTRFDPHSALMLANAAGRQWCVVPEFCYAAVHEALLAHEFTEGLFDPRVLRSLTGLGYDRTLPFGGGAVSIDLPASAPGRLSPPRVAPEPWQPSFDPEQSAVRIGPDPIDLGGIGKGLAVRWSADRLRETHDSFLIEAGGDVHVAGIGPVEGRWNVGVEDPEGGSDPVAVLSLTDTACTTSSVRHRSWRVAGRAVHHLIDPRTGEPGRGGLRAVTVVHPDSATAEVWSKVLFLVGLEGIKDYAESRMLASLWIDDAGQVDMTSHIRPYVIWQRASQP
jgi:thiamine biosynthesis lipoprotein